MDRGGSSIVHCSITGQPRIMSVPETIVSESIDRSPRIAGIPALPSGSRSCSAGRARVAAHRAAVSGAVGHLLAGDFPRFWLARRLLQFARGARRTRQRHSSSARRMRGRSTAGCCKRPMGRPAPCKICTGCVSAASLLLGAHRLVSFRGLRALGWSFSTSLCFAVLLALIPSAQVIAGWAVGWPYAATALLAFGGFFTVEGALTVGMSAGARPRRGPMGGGARPHGGERAHLSAERHVLRRASGRCADRAAASHPGADGALGRDPSGIRGRQLGARLLRDERAVCGGGFRQIRTRRIRASLGREDRLVPAGSRCRTRSACSC